MRLDKRPIQFDETRFGAGLRPPHNRRVSYGDEERTVQIRRNSHCRYKQIASSRNAHRLVPQNASGQMGRAWHSAHSWGAPFCALSLDLGQWGAFCILRFV